jgi:hypothetical protein
MFEFYFCWVHVFIFFDRAIVEGLLPKLGVVNWGDVFKCVHYIKK